MMDLKIDGASMVITDDNKTIVSKEMADMIDKDIEELNKNLSDKEKINIPKFEIKD